MRRGNVIQPDLIPHVAGGDDKAMDEERATFLRQGLGKNTNQRYEVNKGHWETFATEKGWGGDLCMKKASTDEKREVLVDYLRYLKVEVKMNGAEITRIMSALRSRWVDGLSDVRVFSDASVKRARKATKGATSRESHQKKEKARRMPVTMDLIEMERVNDWVNTSDTTRNMVYIAVVLAFNFMFRVSEYVMDIKSEEHALRAEDVLFLRRDKQTPLWAWTVKEVKKEEVQSILFVLRSSKTGEGRYLYLGRESVVEDRTVNDVVEWATLSGIQRGDPFLSRWAMGKNHQLSRKKLTREMINTTLKGLARQAGLASVGFAFTSHSLRIGGATSMMAAGKTRTEVKRTAGWKRDSACDEIYEMNTPADQGALSIASSQFRVLDIADVHKMLPPTFWEA